MSLLIMKTFVKLAAALCVFYKEKLLILQPAS